MPPSLRAPLVLLTALVPTAALWLVPAQAATPAERYAAAAVDATNARRAGHDQVRLRGDACLQRSAGRWARHMARTERLVHQDVSRIMRRCGLSTAGENIAFGYPTGRAVVREWMQSPPHRANILRPQFRLVAIGAARDDDGQWWTSQVFGRR
jgi:uncharacterized protein YkwD